jgi:hypothetical protein
MQDRRRHHGDDEVEARAGWQTLKIWMVGCLFEVQS